MKIAVTASGPEPTSNVDPHFGRAPWILVLDTETGRWAAQDNQVNLASAHGAGIQTAKCVADLSARTVLTGHVGPKACTALKAAGVRAFKADGISAEAAATKHLAEGLPEIDMAGG